MKNLLRRLFGKAPSKPEVQILNTPSQPHASDDMAFRAGAAVAFITPIGAYAGNPAEETIRKRAQQQFLQMDTNSHTVTMN